MNASSKYWQMCQISPSHEKSGYRYREVETARELVKQTFGESSQAKSGENIESRLLYLFYPQDSNIDVARRADAGFSLRCFVSHPILKACQKIDSLFASNNIFTYKDLLPFVLDDDGQTAIVLDQDGQTQLVVDERGKTETSNYKFFSVKILGTYNSDSESKMSLNNWTYLQTKQNKELKNFLSEFGFKVLSDWALLNRARTKQLETLSKRDRSLVKAFHEVYRRDRRKLRNKGTKRCPDPNESQLKEMRDYLQQREIAINTTLSGASHIAIGDLDGDGDLDVLSSSRSDNTISWYENDGAADPSFTTNSITTSATSANYLFVDFLSISTTIHSTTFRRKKRHFDVNKTSTVYRFII